MCHSTVLCKVYTFSSLGCGIDKIVQKGVGVEVKGVYALTGDLSGVYFCQKSVQFCVKYFGF